MAWDKEVQYLKGVGEKRAKQLAKLGILTVGDLLRCYPRGYVDYSAPYTVAEAPYEAPCAVRATVFEKYPPLRISGGRTLYRVDAGDDTGLLQITFFNSLYAAERLQAGSEYLFYGKVRGLGRREMASPQFIAAGSDHPFTAIYHLTAGITSAYLSKLMRTALAGCGTVQDPLPEALRAKYKLPNLCDALGAIHFPPSLAEATAARRRFAFEELFYLELGMKLLRSRNRVASGAPMPRCDPEPFFAALPFAPTGAQRRAVAELCNDFTAPAPMNRLLQGDVGSGKTLVAAAGMAVAAANGYQSVLMAPTEILAVQHAKTLQALLAPLGITVGLLTGSVKGKARKTLLAAIAEGTAQVVVGTHAVLSEQVQFARLGFAVTDEQHRFGVRQRGLLAEKAENPHLLVMSATPIPRTLSLLVFGELDVSVLDELPPGRTPVRTMAVGTALRGRMYHFLEEQITAGRQVFIVCPLIEPAEEESPQTADMQSVVEYREQVAARYLPHRRIGLLHGRLKAADKAEVMAQFAAGELDVLCSTTVVEVGVDVPNASVMVIENAERYGLSALHQLRGRVGRGAAESFCILVSDHGSDAVKERLGFLCRTSDGFEVARYDLEHRGPGDFFGERQHGLPTLQVADATDAGMVEAAAEQAGALLQQDPALAAPQHAALRHEVSRLFAQAGGFAIN